MAQEPNHRLTLPNVDESAVVTGGSLFVFQLLCARPNGSSRSSLATPLTPMSASAPSAQMGTSPASTPAASPKAEQPSTGSQSSTGDSSESQLYAIVEASGQQFWLQPNRYLDIDRLDAEVDSTVTLDTVLLVHGAKGTTLGQPYVNGATVELKVMAHRRGPKILVYKMRRKKKTRRKSGHRQELTRVLVQSIQMGGKPFS